MSFTTYERRARSRPRNTERNWWRIAFWVAVASCAFGLWLFYHSVLVPIAHAAGGPLPVVSEEHCEFARLYPGNVVGLERVLEACGAQN